MEVKSKYILEYTAKDGRVFLTENECKHHEWCLNEIEYLKSKGDLTGALRVARINKMTVSIKLIGSDENFYGVFNFNKGVFKSFLKYRSDNTIIIQMLHDGYTPLSGYIYKEDGTLESHKVFERDKSPRVQVENFLPELKIKRSEEC